MTYTIQPSENGNYILMKIVGEITRESSLKPNLEAHALGMKLGIHRYLVDATEARNVESPVANYQFAYTDMAQATGIDPDAIAAFVVSPEDHSHDFIETVLRNAGQSATLFRDREQAIRFLLEGVAKD
jgi:hypothetical protein